MFIIYESITNKYFAGYRDPKQAGLPVATGYMATGETLAEVIAKIMQQLNRL